MEDIFANGAFYQEHTLLRGICAFLSSMLITNSIESSNFGLNSEFIARNSLSVYKLLI